MNDIDTYRQHIGCFNQIIRVGNKKVYYGNSNQYLSGRFILIFSTLCILATCLGFNLSKEKCYYKWSIKNKLYTADCAKYRLFL